MLKLLFFGSALLLFFAIYFHNIIEFDQDLGRHLLTGKIISETLGVPKINLFSYTQPDFPFINSHWLSEVIFYQGSRISITSLLYLKVLVMLAAGSLTLWTTYRFSKNLTATALAFAIFVPVLLERTEIRPEIFSYLFVAVFLHILISYYVLSIKYYGKLFWILPLVELLWVNMHIYFILGPALASIFCLLKIWETYQENKEFRESLRNTKYLILNAALVWLAPIFNPNGFTGAFYPLQVFNNYGYSIVENQNIFFLREMVVNPNIFYFGVALAVFLAGFLIVRFRLPAVCYLLAVLAVLPLIHIRSFPLLFLIELPVFACLLANTKYKILNTKAVLMIIISLSLFRTYRLASNQYYLSIDSHKRFGNEITEAGKGAADFILSNNLHGPMFNNFDVGSYLDYRLYPKDQVFVDGRPEAYPASFFQNLYIPMQMTEENFDKVDQIYKFNLIVFAHTDATPWGQSFLAKIGQNKNFQLVYLDSYAVVFVRKTVYPGLVLKIVEPKNYLDYLSLGSVAANLGLDEIARKSIEQTYQLNPNSPATNQTLGQVYSQNPITTALGQNYLQKYREKTSLILF